jgi:hypothetical protein
MSLNAYDVRLAALTLELTNQWAQVSESWRDRKREEFSRNHLSELLANVNMARSVMAELDEFVNRVRKDCE